MFDEKTINRFNIYVKYTYRHNVSIYICIYIYRHRDICILLQVIEWTQVYESFNLSILNLGLSDGSFRS